jgi:hypothetical protein
LDVLGLDSGVVLFFWWNIGFLGVCVCFCLEVCVLGKLAVVSFELVDESFAFSDGAVAEELLRWFRESVAVPWVKEVRRVVVRRF